MVTGAVVVGGEIRLPNVRHKKTFEARKAIRLASPAERVALMRVLRGRMQEAKQVLRKT
jgi:hypothetical protein